MNIWTHYNLSPYLCAQGCRVWQIMLANHRLCVGTDLGCLSHPPWPTDWILIYAIHAKWSLAAPVWTNRKPPHVQSSMLACLFVFPFSLATVQMLLREILESKMKEPLSVLHWMTVGDRTTLPLHLSHFKSITWSSPACGGRVCLCWVNPVNI